MLVFVPSAVSSVARVVGVIAVPVESTDRTLTACAVVSVIVVPPLSRNVARIAPFKSTDPATRLPSVHDGLEALARNPSVPTLVAPGAALLFVFAPATVTVDAML